MPTISKLIAGFAFAAVAFFAAQAYIPTQPEGTQFGQFLPISAFIGLVCGWMVMGQQAGKGYRVAIGGGVKTSVVIVIWALIVFCIVLMVRKAFKKRYDSPMEAIVDIFALALEQVEYMLNLPFLATLLIGGVIGGLVAEWSARRWE